MIKTSATIQYLNMDGNSIKRYNLTSVDLINYPDVIPMITDEDVQCYTAFQTVLDAFLDLQGNLFIDYEV